MPKGKFQEPLSQIYRLRRDGRRLCYALYGGKGGPGRELVYFHGWSNSLLEGRILEKEAMERRVRVISIDRPGVGESDMHWLRNGFGLESFAENVHELLTSHLNITHPPHLLSYSGGAQWLLTYRRLFLDTPRETRSAIISPTPPTHLALNRLRARLPRTTFYPVYLSTQYLPPLPLLFLNIVALRTRLGRFGPKEFASQLSNEADIRAVTAPRNREKIEYMIHGLRRAVERNFGVGWWEEGRAVMREPPAWSWVGETGR
ncbi:Alpha/Beta hydrolase protein, partial [Kalaharituber pfeilii]